MQAFRELSPCYWLCLLSLVLLLVHTDFPWGFKPNCWRRNLQLKHHGGLVQCRCSLCSVAYMHTSSIGVYPALRVGHGDGSVPRVADLGACPGSCGEGPRLTHAQATSPALRRCSGGTGLRVRACSTLAALPAKLL